MWVIAHSPGEAKRRGRKVTMRDDWKEVKIDIMLDLLQLKFSDPILKQQLLATGNAKLVEGNYWHDNFWGTCRCGRCNNVRKENWLGRLLM